MLLNCHTYFSFCYGTLSPDELLHEAVSKGYSTYVLADINNTSAVLDSLRLAKERLAAAKNVDGLPAAGAAIKVIPGIDFRNGVQQQYVAIAKNNQGFKEMNEHLTYHLHGNKPFENRAPEMENVFIIYPLKNYTGWALNKNEWVGVNEKDFFQLQFTATATWQKKLVVLHPVSFIQKQHYNAHRLLRAIDKNVLLSKLPAEEQTGADEIMPPKAALYNAFICYPEIINNTEHLLHACHVEFEFGKLSNKNLKYYTGNATGDIQLLRDESIRGLPYRYSTITTAVMERLEKELKVIEQMHFASYFLINLDIVKYARHKDYFYVGRGSGANSMVAYLLRITDVDPIDLDLYFERFINPYRSSPPDFDMDFNWTDREDITRYIFERFGRERTALLATYATFQHDAVTRELGKVFGLPGAEIDKLQRIQSITEADSMGKLVLQYSKLIEGFPSHLSVHSSGIIILEEPVTTYTATFLPPKNYATTQFSMLEAEDIGIAKFDILSQRGLGKIKDSVTIVKQNQNIEIDIHDVAKFKTDVVVKKLLSEGKCIGCFYIESPAMRMLLSKLQADDYLRLVAASSIIRPGVSKSGMMNQYIIRYRDVAKREAARAEIPELYALLEETYGVMVYQEDVIKVAHYIADLSLAEADYLRRGMSWKFKQRNEFHVVKEKFVANCRKKNYAEKTINDIWNQIESFANYAFSKAHSASYAVESFQALYMKAYFPLEYMVATLNNGGGFYRTEFYVHEARMHGAHIVAPCINNSDVITTIQGQTIYLGFQMIRELQVHSIKAILSERTMHGEFAGLYDFIQRVPISLDQLVLLIRVGAFNFTGINKKELLWQAHLQINPQKKPVGRELFAVVPKKYELPPLHHSALDNAFDEIELLGFALCSPFFLLKDKIPSALQAADLKKLIGKTISIVGYLVTTKPTRTHKGDKMYFGTFIDTAGHWIDTVHFPPSAKAFPFRGPGAYLLHGRVVLEFDFIYLDINKMERLVSKNRDDIDDKRESQSNPLLRMESAKVPE